MYYWDHPDLKDVLTANITASIEMPFSTEFVDYLEATPDGCTTGYTLKLIPAASATKAFQADWYIGYALGNNTKVTEVVKKRLAEQATSYGLFQITTAERVLQL